MKNERGFTLAFRHRRIEARLELLTKTECKATNEELDDAARKAERRASDRRGYKSEERFSTFAKQIRFVKSVRNASLQSDVFSGIDKWITFTENFKLPELPVQIMSSDRGVTLYKYGDSKEEILPDKNFKRMREIQIVVNCGPTVSQKYLRKQLINEVERIRPLILKDR